jgi:site-specific recombinase XerD
MIEQMQLRAFCPATHRPYLRAAREWGRDYRRSPETLTAEEVRGCLLHRVNEGRRHLSAINGISAALRFLYSETLKRPEVALAIPPRKTPRPLPEVLSVQEIERLFAATPNIKDRTILMGAYAAGLHRNEIVQLKVADIDSSRMMIRIREAKGRKDRYSILSETRLEALRAYGRWCRPADGLFPGDQPGQHLSSRMLGHIYTQARARAGIQKRGGIHILRHCFAAHLLEAGVDVRTIQSLMGHRSLSSTARHLHLTRKQLNKTPSLLDALNPRVLRCAT